jgi:subtilisin family serine protease
MPPDARSSRLVFAIMRAPMIRCPCAYQTQGREGGNMVDDPRIQRLHELLQARSAPGRVRINADIRHAKQAFEARGKEPELLVKLFVGSARGWTADKLHEIFSIISLTGVGITFTGEPLYFDTEPQQQALLLQRLGDQAFVAEARLKLGIEVLDHALLQIPDLLQIEASSARMVADLDLSLPALFHGRPVGDPPQPSEIPQHGGGSGVVIGVVDFGCDFVHPNFRHQNGMTRLRALEVLDAHGTPIHTFPEAMINGFLTQQPDPYAMYEPHARQNQHNNVYNPERFGAHGTLVLDAATGNGRFTFLPGVAPKATPLFIQLRPDMNGQAPLATSAVRAVERIFTSAGATPAVANLSMNPHKGPRNGLGELTEHLARILSWQPEQAEKRAIVVAAGNVRGAALRSAGTSIRWTSQREEAQALPVVLPEHYEPNKGQTIRIYHPVGTELQVRFDVPSRIDYTGNRTITLNPAGALHEKVFWPPGKYIVTDQLVVPGRYETSVLLTPDALKASRRWTFYLTLPPDQIGSVEFYAWIDRNPECQIAFDATAAKDDYTLGDFAATPGVIAVGAYYALMADAPARYYSAQGPSEMATSPLPWDPFAETGRKPDVIAPGHGVHVALSHSGKVPQDRVSEAFRRAVVASGTSLAAAHVSGLIALLFERVPNATAEEIRRVLIETAEPVQGQTQGQWLPRAGYGRVHAARALLHPFPRIIAPGAGASLSNPSVTLAVRVRNPSVNANDVDAVTAQVYQPPEYQPFVTAALTRRPTALDYEETINLGVTGAFIVEVIVRMTSFAGLACRAYPVRFNVT